MYERQRKLAKRRRMLMYLMAVALLYTALHTLVPLKGFKKETQSTQTYTKKHQLAGIEIETISRNGDMKMGVHFPKTTSQKVNEQLKTFANAQIEAFESKAQGGKKGELSLEFDVHRYSEQVVAFSFLKQEKIAKRQVRTRYTKTYDLKLEKELALEDIFQGEYLEKLSALSMKEMKKAMVFQPSYEQMKQLEAGVSAEKDNFSHLVLEEKSAVLFLEEDQFGDIKHSMERLKLPLEELAPFFTKAYAPETAQPEENKEGREQDPQDSKETPAQQEEQPGPKPEKPQDPKKIKVRQYKDEELAGKKLVAITFDDGPHQTQTPRLLNILAKKKVPATFYVLGSRVKYYPEIVKRAAQEGHQIDSHTESHKDLTSLNDKELQGEIKKTDDIFKKVTGRKPSTVRPPYGALNKKVSDAIARPILLWSVDSLDWKLLDKEKVKKGVLRDTNDGAIILLHDIHKTSVDAVEDIITSLEGKGYTFVTVDQLIRVRDKQAKAGVRYTRLAPKAAATPTPTPTTDKKES